MMWRLGPPSATTVLEEWGAGTWPTPLLTSTTKTFAASAGWRGLIRVARAIRLEMRGARLDEGCMVDLEGRVRIARLGRFKRGVRAKPSC